MSHFVFRNFSPAELKALRPLRDADTTPNGEPMETVGEMILVHLVNEYGPDNNGKVRTNYINKDKLTSHQLELVSAIMKQDGEGVATLINFRFPQQTPRDQYPHCNHKVTTMFKNLGFNIPKKITLDLCDRKVTVLPLE